MTLQSNQSHLNRGPNKATTHYLIFNTWHYYWTFSAYNVKFNMQNEMRQSTYKARWMPALKVSQLVCFNDVNWESLNIYKGCTSRQNPISFALTKYLKNLDQCIPLVRFLKYINHMFHQDNWKNPLQTRITMSTDIVVCAAWKTRLWFSF